MANKKQSAPRRKGPVTGTEASGHERDPSRPGEAKGTGKTHWIVPGILAALVVVAVVVYVRMGNSVAPELPTALQASSPSSSDAARRPETPLPSAPPTPAPAAPSQPNPTQSVEVTPVHPEPTSPDPLHGRISLAQATEGLPAGTRLVAEIETSMGTFNCDLWPDRAPNNVANFVGLARGRRDFWDPVAGRWTRRPFYDGSVFHRVIPDFMIQGGDILRSGRGGPGYEIPDENVTNHDEAGLLCMANHGPNTGGGQFFLMEEAKPHLNGSYSVLGKCSPANLVEQIARVPRDPRDRPLSPVYIQHIRVHR